MKWFLRIVIGLVSIIVLLILIQYITFVAGRNKVIAALPGNSLIAETSNGPVEYQIQGTSNRYVLFLHGTPGSYRTFMASSLIDKGFSVISPSRPGYFRTPLSTGQSLKGQADAYAALLNYLDIDSVAVIGFSGGGPSAIQFAINHPEMCSQLIVIAGVAEKTIPQETSVMQGLMSTEFGSWVLMGMLASQFEDENTSHIAKEYVHSIVFPFSETSEGQLNDFELFTTLPPFPLGNITSPTLIIHGTDDEIVPFSQAELMKTEIPNATLIAEEGKDHYTIVFFEMDRSLEKAADFITDVQ